MGLQRRIALPRMELYFDQGGNFNSKVFGEVAHLLELRYTHTTTLNPQLDGIGETHKHTSFCPKMLLATIVPIVPVGLPILNP